MAGAAFDEVSSGLHEREPGAAKNSESTNKLSISLCDKTAPPASHFRN